MVDVVGQIQIEMPFYSFLAVPQFGQHIPEHLGVFIDDRAVDEVEFDRQGFVCRETVVPVAGFDGVFFPAREHKKCSGEDIDGADQRFFRRRMAGHGQQAHRWFRAAVNNGDIRLACKTTADVFHVARDIFLRIVLVGRFDMIEKMVLDYQAVAVFNLHYPIGDCTVGSDIVFQAEKFAEDDIENIRSLKNEIIRYSYFQHCISSRAKSMAFRMAEFVLVIR